MIQNELRLSQRVLLQRGDTIRLRGGPVWVDRLGQEHSMGYRGLARFVGYDETAGVALVAMGRDGYGGCGAVPIGEQDEVEPEIVQGWYCVAYRITKLRGPMQKRIERKGGKRQTRRRK